MNGWAKERLAPTIVAIFVMLLATPSLACDRTTGCPAGSVNTDNLPANMLPTYPEAKPQTQATAAPVNLRKFTKKQTRSARRASSRKARASKARTSKAHTSKARASKAHTSKTLASKTSRTEPTKIAPALANANAELTEADAATAPADQAAPTDAPTPTAATEPATQDGDAPASAQQTDVVAAEDFNDVDRTAWENPEPPRLMQFTALDSHAELRAEDSKWSHTSTVGKIFVALGALLTIGSAIRMLIA